MRKMLNKFVACVFAAMLLLPCIPAFADSVESIIWETDVGVITLSDTPDGHLSAITVSTLNNVEVSFSGETAKYATLLAVPVEDGKAKAPTPLNAALVLQQPVEDGKASFCFQLKPSINNGIYAMYVGGTNTSYVTKYFAVSDYNAPELTGGRIIQYDDYKNSIVLPLDVDDDADFEVWAEETEKMSVTLSSGGNSVAVASEDITVDTDAKTIAIDTSKGTYNEIFPAEGSKPEGNVQKATISIIHPEFWGDTEFGGSVEGSFGLVIPEFSAEGFAKGIDFDLTLQSESALTNVRALVILYDEKKLVHAMMSEPLEIEAGAEKEVAIRFQGENIKESGSFSVKIMLWDSLTLSPYVACVPFP